MNAEPRMPAAEMPPPEGDHIFARVKRRLEREDLFFHVLTVVFLLLALLSYTYPSVAAVQQVYRENKIKAEERALMAEQTRLRLEYEMLMSAEEMESRALAAGLSPLARDRTVYLRKK